MGIASNTAEEKERAEAWDREAMDKASTKNAATLVAMLLISFGPVHVWELYIH